MKRPNDSFPQFSFFNKPLTPWLFYLQQIHSIIQIFTMTLKPLSAVYDPNDWTLDVFCTQSFKLSSKFITRSLMGTVDLTLIQSFLTGLFQAMLQPLHLTRTFKDSISRFNYPISVYPSQPCNDCHTSVCPALVSVPEFIFKIHHHYFKQAKFKTCKCHLIYGLLSD